MENPPSRNDARNMRPEQFVIDKTIFSASYTVTCSNGEHFYAEMSAYRAGTSMTLHFGRDNKGPVLGKCHLPCFSRTLPLGITDTDNPERICWEHMVKQGWGIFSSQWVITQPQGNEKNLKQLIWKPTQSSAPDGTRYHYFSGRKFKLLDACNPAKNLAVFAMHIGFTTSAVLQVNIDEGIQSRVSILLMCLTLCERERRKRQLHICGVSVGGIPSSSVAS
jgi:hypothetical protein